MQNTPLSYLPFEQLPSEARGLLLIFASAALARYQSHPPKPSELTNSLEAVWNSRRLTRKDLSDPYRMTRLLEEHFAPSTLGLSDEALAKGTR